VLVVGVVESNAIGPGFWTMLGMCLGLYSGYRAAVAITMLTDEEPGRGDHQRRWEMRLLFRLGGALVVPLAVVISMLQTAALRHWVSWILVVGMSLACAAWITALAAAYRLAPRMDMADWLPVLNWLRRATALCPLLAVALGIATGGAVVRPVIVEHVMAVLILGALGSLALSLPAMNAANEAMALAAQQSARFREKLAERQAGRDVGRNPFARM